MTQAEIDFFDKLAPDWDANEILSTPERIIEIFGKMRIKPGMEILDLGTGTGVLLPYLSKMVGESGHISAVDLSEGMLSKAREKYGNLKNVDFYRIDFEEEAIPGLYDMAILYSVYPHLHRPKDTIEWLFKVNLKQNGMIIIAFPTDEKFINDIHHERESDSDHLLSAPKLASVITGWGFKAEVISYKPDEYIIGIRR